MDILLKDAYFYNLIDLDIGMNPDMTQDGWIIVNQHMIKPSCNSLKTIHLYFCKLIAS